MHDCAIVISRRYATCDGGIRDPFRGPNAGALRLTITRVTKHGVYKI